MFADDQTRDLYTNSTFATGSSFLPFKFYFGFPWHFCGQSSQFAVVCLEEFSRCTELLAKPRSNRRRGPHHTHTRSVDHYGPQLAGTGPLICVYTKLMGQIRGELYSNSCRLGCNTVVNPAKLISSVPERQPFAFQSQCGNNLAV